MSYLRAFSTLGCPELTLDEVFALATRHRIPGVELRALAGTLDLSAYFALRFSTEAEAAAYMARESVRIFSLDTSFQLCNADTESRDDLLRFVPWAEALGAAHLRVFDGKRADETDALNHAIEALTWWRDLRARHGWRTDLMIETHDSLFTAEKIRSLITRVPDVAILWDSHHTWQRGLEDPLVTWEAIKGNVVHVHVKDSIAQPSAKHPFTYVLPGTGVFPAASLFNALRRDAFAGVVSLEWEKLWHPYLAPLDEALCAAGSREWW